MNELQVQGLDGQALRKGADRSTAVIESYTRPNKHVFRPSEDGVLGPCVYSLL